jgi:hypothetical protein
MKNSLLTNSRFASGIASQPAEKFRAWMAQRFSWIIHQDLEGHGFQPCRSTSGRKRLSAAVSLRALHSA